MYGYERSYAKVLKKQSFCKKKAIIFFALPGTLFMFFLLFVWRKGDFLLLLHHYAISEEHNN